jgi:hypothetical protein
VQFLHARRFWHFVFHLMHTPHQEAHLFLLNCCRQVAAAVLLYSAQHKAL